MELRGGRHERQDGEEQRRVRVDPRGAVPGAEGMCTLVCGCVTCGQCQGIPGEWQTILSQGDRLQGTKAAEIRSGQKPSGTECQLLGVWTLDHSWVLSNLWRHMFQNINSQDAPSRGGQSKQGRGHIRDGDGLTPPQR